MRFLGSLLPMILMFRSEGAAMDYYSDDTGFFIMQCFKAFSDQELAEYEEHRNRLLTDGFSEDDAMEAACYQVVQGRGDNGR